MRCFLFAVLLLASTCAIAWGAANRLVDGMEDPSVYVPAQPELQLKWTGTVALQTADCKEGKGCLRFDIHSPKTGEESYPQWARSLDPAKNDWTHYSGLSYWVKVTSTDPAVKFKNMCVVVYNGTAPLQQFKVHEVPVGRWMQFTDPLLSYNRDAVRGLVICMYETNPAAKDDYTWLIDDLELVGMDTGAVGFDSMGIVAPEHRVVRPLHDLKTATGLGLSFDHTGRIGTVALPGGRPQPASAQALGMSGLCVRDWRKGETLEPVTGKVTADGKSLTQSGMVFDGLEVSARFTSENDRIKCHVTVHDTKSEDRPVTVYFGVPVQAKGWRWWDDIATSRPIEGTNEFTTNLTSQVKPAASAYPFCCISDGKQALSFAQPVVPPRLSHSVYNPQLGLLYLAYDFCLTPAAVKQKQTVAFDFYLTSQDPKWGMRSVVDWYYRQFPDYFVKRVPQEGGWGCWGNYATNPNIPDLGFMYHWGPSDPKGMAEAVKFDNQHGYLSFPYIELGNLHVSMEGYPGDYAGPEQILERIHYIADPQRKEPLPHYPYAFPYESRYGDYDTFMRQVFQAYLKSLIYDADGKLYGTANKSEFNLLVAKYIPFNPDPDIPGGAGEFFLKTYLPVMEKYLTDNGAKDDGYGWDNFYCSGAGLDYRREHFAYADDPLVFNAQSLQPALLKDMCTYKLQRRVAGALRQQGKYLIANQCSISPVTATMTQLDIFGYEWNVAAAATYARTMGHHKPVCSLPVQPAHYLDPFVRDHLLYGVWPGGYADTVNPGYLALMREYVPIVRRECAAGWEPITLAQADDPQVQVERFGGGRGQELLLSVKNRAEAEAPVKIAVGKALLANVSGQPQATELVSGQAVEVTSTAEGLMLNLKAPGQQVLVISIK